MPELDAMPVSELRQLLPLAGWLALGFSPALGAVFVSPGGWYATLRKPSWNPPAWVFGPAWTALYLMMGTAAWLVWRDRGWSGNAVPLRFFLLQLALNALWTPVFFGLRRTGAALAIIALLWLALAVTLVAFWRVSTPAGALLVPYLAWVSFASALNFSVWRLNRRPVAAPASSSP